MYFYYTRIKAEKSQVWRFSKEHFLLWATRKKTPTKQALKKRDLMSVHYLAEPPNILTTIIYPDSSDIAI